MGLGDLPPIKHRLHGFTHVNDVAPVIAEAVNVSAARNQVFNVGADVLFSVNHLARLIAQALGAECRIQHLDPRNEVKLAISDRSKIDRVFGNRPKTTLEAGLRGDGRLGQGQWGAREQCFQGDRD